MKLSSFVRSIYSEKYYCINSYSLKIMCRQAVSTKFQRFKIIYLCTMGCRLKTLLLILMVYPWMSLFCFIATKIALGSCPFRRCSFKIPRRMFHSSAARIRGSSFRYNEFLSGISPNMCNLWSHLWCAICWTSWKRKNGRVVWRGRLCNV